MATDEGRLRRDVFISHAEEDSWITYAVQRTLEENGIRCWVAPRDIRPGSDFVGQISAAMDGCRVVVLVLSSRATESAWVLNELTMAAQRNVPIVVFMVEDAPPSGLEVIIASRQRVSALNVSPSDSLRNLVTAVERQLEPASRSRRLTTLLPSRRRDSNAAILERDMGAFEENLRSNVGDEILCDRMMDARFAIQNVASFLDSKWERGRHTLEPSQAYPVRRLPNDKIGTALGEDVHRMIIAALDGPRRPRCRIESDEGPTENAGSSEECFWITDPLDGSRHLMRHLPLFTTTITLTTLRKQRYYPSLALVYAPVTGEFLFAVQEPHGRAMAFLNDWDHPLTVSGRFTNALEDPDKPYVYAEFPNVDSKEETPTEFGTSCEALMKIFETIYRVRGFGLGSLGMSYAASGSFEAYVTLSGRTRLIDVLAGALLVTGAGGHARVLKARDLGHGKPGCLTEVYALAGNRDVFETVSKLQSVGDLFDQRKVLYES